MPFKFKLEVVRMECVHGQLREWGKDEMRMIGFGVSRKGHFFSTGYRNLGSYGTGDVKPPGSLPQTLFERELEDDGLEVMFFFWLVEEDGAGVRDSAASLEDQFRTRFLGMAASMASNRFPRECIPFLALLRVGIPFTGIVRQAGSAGRNDEVYLPQEAFLRLESTSSAALPVVTQDQQFQRSKRGGHYLITLRTTYQRVDVIIG